MKNYFKPKTWLITILMFMIALGFSAALVYYEFGLEKNIKITRASAGDNVTGWAWNANTGWISFNCTGDSPACGASDYGVSVDLATGQFSGYAWSANMGWISFNRRTCVGGGQDGKYCRTNSDCSSNSCRLDGPGAAGAPLSAPYDSPASLEYNAIYSFATKTVTGWAKILSLGGNGWIKFSGNKQDGQPWATGVTIDPASGDFSGWAWNANDVAVPPGGGIGWISFNCANESPACSGTNYKVVGKINRPPTVTNLTAPNWSYSEAAGSSGALNANLNFGLVDLDSGSFGSAYQIIITKADDSAVLNTGKCTGYNTPAANPVKCKIDNSICLKNGATGCINPGNCACQFPLTQTDGIWYGTGYKWSVQVWDNYDVASAVTPYSTNPDTDNNDGVAPTFTTYKHKFPAPSATWFPVDPSRGEKVKFTDTSKRFFSVSPTVPVSCSSATCDWLWTVPGGATIDDNTTSTPTIIFNSADMNSVKLKVIDETDTGAVPYYSEININIDINANLPGWKEVKPE